MKGLHVRFEGFTATYPYPFLRSGTALTLPVPPYSNILGMLGACAGHDMIPNDLWLGYEFQCGAFTSIDLERTERLQTDKKGRLRANPEHGVMRRQFHVFPSLDVYLSDLTLMPSLHNPITPPRFGRSQDLAWITVAREIDLTEVPHAAVRGTLAPYPETGIGQVLPPLADFYLNNHAGFTRTAGRISRYVAIPSGEYYMELTANGRLQLFHPSDSEKEEYGVVMTHF
jgi:CRISPR-associated Cas5-like protein